MYLGAVALLMLVLPFGSALIGHGLGGVPLIGLIGKWYVFWAVGVRLLLAGARQNVQPEFTLEQIFRMKSKDALPIVRELGIANFALGVVGIWSLWRPDFVLPAAIAGAIFYGAAGVRHTFDSDRGLNQTVAMATDLFACAVLAIYAASALWA